MPCADFGWDTLHGRRPVQAILCSIGQKAQLHYLNVIMGSNYGSTDSLEREIIRKGFPPIQGKMYPNLYCHLSLIMQCIHNKEGMLNKYTTT